METPIYSYQLSMYVYASKNVVRKALNLNFQNSNEISSKNFENMTPIFTLIPLKNFVKHFVNLALAICPLSSPPTDRHCFYYFYS